MRQIVTKPSMRLVAQHLRMFSTETASAMPTVIFVSPGTEKRQNPLLGPNRKFPLPGDVSSPLFHQQNTVSTAPEEQPFAPLPTHSLVELTSPPELKTAFYPLQQTRDVSKETSDLPVEIVAQPCPKLMKRDLKRLFPGLDVSPSNVTVLNITQKSENDMSAWSNAMETERDILTASFISAATSICSSLHKNGYWADFIDPSSGRPYLGKFTNACLFETDDSYTFMGFRIEDLGCCKVLQHAVWGTKAFVGTLFTNAPIDSPLVQEMLQKVKDEC